MSHPPDPHNARLLLALRDHWAAIIARHRALGLSDDDLRRASEAAITKLLTVDMRHEKARFRDSFAAGARSLFEKLLADGPIDAIEGRQS